MDKKIQIVTEAELEKKMDPDDQPFTSLTGYKEVLSSELLEAALLAMDQQLSMSQKIIDLEKELILVLGKETVDANFISEQAEEFQLEAVHIFSRQGLLLIKLKKIYGMIHLIQAEYPEYSSILINASQKINELKKQLVGEANEKTINESL
ncbi:hypothetical protein RV15_GL000428 [Enterococcus silesiacus]|uniref:Uncharacterized protein n=1 Tax=Enterococcus silesiacus TaxID=332949 RepID=A0AA91JP78_9ENTE|nr:hypothetical protein RV15_GL000428 [Enterococcus silesiacus]